MASVSEVLASIEGQRSLALEAFSNKTIREVMADHFKDVVFDEALEKRIYQFQIGYVNISRDYIEFFGSNLLGVHVIRFREADVLRFFDDVLDVDYDSLKADIRMTKTIDHNWKIAGDIFNLTLVYVIHKALTTPKNKETRERMAYNTALVFFYRCIAAILSDWIKYPTDPKIAQAAYANLSNKFLIKRLESWHQVMDYRAKELSGKEGLHRKRLEQLGSDDDMVRVINDSANRIRDMLLNYYAVFKKAHDQGDRLGVTSSTIKDADGQEVLKDTTRHVDGAITLIKEYLSDSTALSKDSLIRVVINLNSNTSYRMLRDTLTWMSANYQGKDFKLIDEFVTSSIVYSYHLIDSKLEPNRVKDLGYVLQQLKNFYLSTRSTDPDLMKIRGLAEQILKKAHGNISTPLMLATRTATILYITFRVLVGKRA